MSTYTFTLKDPYVKLPFLLKWILSHVQFVPAGTAALKRVKAIAYRPLNYYSLVTKQENVDAFEIRV